MKRHALTMFQNTNTTGRAVGRGLGLALIFAALSLSADGVLAARGGKPQPTGTPATVTFDDLLGDAIKSDGLGPYDATIENGVITLTTGKKRKLSFDFSTCLGGACEDSTGSSTTDSSATMTVHLLKGGAAGFEFKGGGGHQSLVVFGLEISTFDDDGDGSTDRYVIETSGEGEHRLFREFQRGGRAVEPGTTRFEWIADFSMPWGIEVVVD